MIPKDGLKLSIVVPVFDESESLPELLVWIDRVVTENELQPMEMIMVDDGSSDDSWKVITNLKKSYPWIKAIRFRRNYGKSAALQKGFEAARGAVVITMDADLQDDPFEIPALIEMLENGNDLVSGWKRVRHDPITKTIPSRFFNLVTRWTTGIKLHDFNCGLKAYDKRVVKNISVYGEMHHFVTGAIPLTVEIRRSDGLGPARVRPAATPHGIGHQRCIRRPGCGMDLPPIVNGGTVLVIAQGRRGIVNPTVGAVAGDDPVIDRVGQHCRVG